MNKIVIWMTRVSHFQFFDYYSIFLSLCFLMIIIRNWIVCKIYSWTGLELVDVGIDINIIIFFVLFLRMDIKNVTLLFLFLRIYFIVVCFVFVIIFYWNWYVKLNIISEMDYFLRISIKISIDSIVCPVFICLLISSVWITLFWKGMSHYFHLLWLANKNEMVFNVFLSVRYFSNSIV